MRYNIMIGNVRAKDKMMATLETQYEDFESAHTAANSILIMFKCMLNEPTEIRDGENRCVVELWNTDKNEKIYVVHIESVPME